LPDWVHLQAIAGFILLLDIMPTDLRGWHAGERLMQGKLNFGGEISMSWTMISSGMDAQHQEFHSTRLPFIPITTLDEVGRPWGSIFAGPGGETGFVKSPDHYTLVMDIDLWDGDPFMRNHKLWKRGQDQKKTLLAGIGIEFPTRRRNKFAGWITDIVVAQGRRFKIGVNVNQALGYVSIIHLIDDS
jgi:predicted pyridoxine 5'-phosphate oxidase superfamily flavin-nucleotide-binding protein